LQGFTVFLQYFCLSDDAMLFLQTPTHEWLTDCPRLYPGQLKAIQASSLITFACLVSGCRSALPDLLQVCSYMLQPQF